MRPANFSHTFLDGYLPSLGTVEARPRSSVHAPRGRAFLTIKGDEPLRRFLAFFGAYVGVRCYICSTFWTAILRGVVSEQLRSRWWSAFPVFVGQRICIPYQQKGGTSAEFSVTVWRCGASRFNSVFCTSFRCETPALLGHLEA